jgi:hypothetical protein
MLLCLSGCLRPEQVESSSWMQRFKKDAIPPNHALIEVALIERPIGDEYINSELWRHSAELIVEPEKFGVLNDNGFRVGRLIGSPPEGLQELITSAHGCRARGRVFPQNTTVPIDLETLPAPTAYDVVLSGEHTEITLDQARFFLDVTARITKDGTLLKFTPKVEHGAPVLPFKAAADKAEWVLQIGKAAKTYAEMSWEVTLGPNQYLFIGGRLDRDRTIGRTAFTRPEETGNVQYLLVVRNCRAVTADEAHETSVSDMLRADRTTPLALQAAAPAARARSN